MCQNTCSMSTWGAVFLNLLERRLTWGLALSVSLPPLTRVPISSLVACCSLFLLSNCEPASVSLSCWALRVASGFMCYYAFTMRSTMREGGFFERERRGTWRVVTLSWEQPQSPFLQHHPPATSPCWIRTHNLGGTHLYFVQYLTSRWWSFDVSGYL